MNKVNEILATAREKIKAETGVTLKIAYTAPKPDYTGFYNNCLKTLGVSMVNGRRGSFYLNAIRQAITFIIREEMPGVTYADIAQLFGYKDHTNARDSYRRAKDHYETGDEMFLRVYSQLLPLVETGVVV